jgi:peptidoglycan/xylan/chitin deacetylase (PgdA/CDA1 family)
MNLDGIAALLLVGMMTLVGLALWRLLGGRPRGPGRRVVRLVVALLIATTLFGLGAYRLMNARSVQLIGRQVTSIQTGAKVVALTFDDGPTGEYVDAVLADLARYRARGTFFVIGSAAQDNESALRALIAAGHEIGNHSFTHPRLVFVSTGTVAREVESTDRVIRSAGYRGPILFRPPFGKRLVSAPYYLWRHERTTVMWDLEPDSMADIADDPGAMSEYVAENARPGSIVLLHVWYDGRSAARAALPLILARLTAQGYRFVTVSELLNET